MSVQFSIITPSFNRLKFIGKTIESVLNQTYPALEYIVVDADSSDGTLDLLEKYKSNGSIKYLSEPDDGMYDAINKGFEMAAGDVIAYLNTDDIYLPWTLATVASVFEKHPNTDVVFGDSVIVDLKSNKSFLNIRPSFHPLWLYAGNRIAQPTLFLKRECFISVGDFRNEVDLLADCEYWLRLVDKGYNFRKVNEFLAIEVNHEDTIRETKRDIVSKEKAYLIEKYSSRLSNTIKTSAVLKLKKMETLINYLQFVLKSNFMLRHGAWGNTIGALDISFRPLTLIRSKIDGKKRQVWKFNLGRLLE
ncbi:hypothetical protein DSCA_23250 [Desulfosarcina alkanivorans]|jgi:glycosyltransferase involved in cell wall biosynthesis|uniref:Glycosyltransferase 2-like domain-containing protein n=1 Tax=Desulfosarcina alkanivorans TaxID=571177 RepID=A0A5K7YJ31_9BACT|nr:glycosyltransferase family 2 protein [Desulfosarcina alkanivorans]BBO68395.1 hypothetical protein DSCA_23250 [Desulfosarcina alkanivorans]